MEVIKATSSEVLKTAPELKAICITLRLPNNKHYGRIGLCSHKISWSFASIDWGEKKHQNVNPCWFMSFMRLGDLYKGI